jgi:hypothetical protein
MTFWDEDRYRGDSILPDMGIKAAVYMARYERIGTNVFKWSDLPEGVLSQDIELSLIRGDCMIYHSPEAGPMLAKALIKGYNAVNRPVEMKPILFNSRNPFSGWARPTLRDGIDCVYLHDLTDWRKGRIDYIRDAKICDMMADIDIAIVQQIINQRAPIIFSREGPAAGGGVKGKAFVKSVLNGVNAYLFSGGVEGGVTTLKLDSPYNVESLLNIRKTYFNEGLELMGVNNEPGLQKRERMNNIEVTANDELLNVFLYDALATREMVCDKIKDVFGVNTTVTLIDSVRISEKDEYIGPDDMEDEE